MSYTAANLALFAESIGSRSAGIRTWVLRGTDALSTVTGASYVSDAVDKGMTAGDIVVYLKTDTKEAYWLVVGSLSSTAGTLTGSGGMVGATTSSLVGFYGATPVARPSGTNQSSVTTSAITAVVATSTSTNAAGFVTSAQVTALAAAVNSLITRVALTTDLANALREAMVQTTGVGLIKGSA